MTRITSNEILDRADRQEIFSFFLIGEFITTVTIILIVTVSSFLLTPENIMKGLGYGLVILMGTYCLSTTYTQLNKQ